MKNSCLFLSCKGETLPVVRVLQNEGVPARAYLHDLAYQNSYKNLMPKVGLDTLVKAIMQSEVIVIDTIAKNKKTGRDMALLDKFGISRNIPDLYGRLGDILKRPPWSKQVIGGGEEIAEYELNRAKGIELAKKAGFSIPPYHEFKSLKAAVKFLQSPEGQRQEYWYFKASGNEALDLTYDDRPAELIDYLSRKVPQRLGTDKVDCILQQTIDGNDKVELSRELWRKPDGTLVVPNSTLEDKRLHSRESGPRVGCAVNSVWRDADLAGPIHKQIAAASKLLGDYCGPLDANCILTPDLKAWFLEWTLRFGYSALYLLLTLIFPGKMANFFLNLFETMWREGFVASQVLSLYPFPPTCNNRKDFEEMIVGNLIPAKFNTPGMWWLDVMADDEDNFRVAGADGLIGVATGYDETLEGAIKKSYKKVEDIKITGNKQMWPLQEHLDSHLDRYNKLKRWGII